MKTPERLVYTWDWEKDGGDTEFGELEGHESQVTVEFRESGKRTQLVLTHVKTERSPRIRIAGNLVKRTLIEF